MKPIFFASPEAFRHWLEQHHASEKELLVGFHKRHTGKPSLTWPESVDEALSFGWIDGIRRSVDADRYTIRFTPRKPTSIWSAVNIKRVAELTAQGRMRPAGLAAFAKRDEARSAIYSYERAAASFDAGALAAFKKNAKAWTFFEAQPPGYKRLATYYVTSAKRPETRAKRLAALMAASGRHERIGLLAPPAKKPAKK